MAASPVRIGPYELVSRLGIGGMAETYLAVRRGPGGFEQRVCLKRVRRDLDRDPEFVRQFLAEAAIAAKLRHAAIAQVLDFGCEGDDYYMALELVEGLDLRALLEEVDGGLSPDIALHVAVELATALDFAHRAGGDGSEAPVVHRDVSASNALISVEGEVKLADFGIARSLSGPQHTQTGVVKGKVPYLAPEYARSGRFDARCDLFSLGVLLYETACGERPHDGATDLETLERAMTGAHRSLAERTPALPTAFAEIIEQLLEPDPELRFQSAAALLEALIALPGNGRARRELGALVTRVRRARAAESPQPASEQPLPRTLAMPDANAPAHDTRATPVVGATRTQARAEATSNGSAALDALDVPYTSLRRGPRLALAIAAAFALAALGLWLAQRVATPHTSSADTARATREHATAAEPRAAEAAKAPAPAAAIDIIQHPIAITPDEAAPAPDVRANGKPRNQHAQLEVIVLPYGEVFVDGKRIGVAPVTLSLGAGEHDIVGKHQSGVFERRISLSAGEHRQLVLR